VGGNFETTDIDSFVIALTRRSTSSGCLTSRPPSEFRRDSAIPGCRAAGAHSSNGDFGFARLIPISATERRTTRTHQGTDMSGSNTRASSFLAAKHRAWFVIALGAVALCHSAAAEPRPFDVPSGEASTTLPDFARQAGLKLLFDYTAVKTVKTHAVSGRLEPEAALAEMLLGAGTAVRESQ
jgi:hypothetical protein